MNRMCEKNNTIYMWREQGIIEWSWRNLCWYELVNDWTLWLAYAKSDRWAWSLLLLAATVQSFAHMPLGLSDCNNMQAWQTSHVWFSSKPTNFRINLEIMTIVNMFCYVWHAFSGMAHLWQNSQPWVRLVFKILNFSNKQGGDENRLLCSLAHGIKNEDLL